MNRVDSVAQGIDCRGQVGDCTGENQPGNIVRVIGGIIQRDRRSGAVGQQHELADAKLPADGVDIGFEQCQRVEFGVLRPLRLAGPALVEIDHSDALLERRAAERLHGLTALARAAVEEEDRDAVPRTGDAVPKFDPIACFEAMLAGAGARRRGGR